MVSSRNGRKYTLTLIGLFLITAVTCTSIKFAVIQGVLPTFIGGILGVLGLYHGANVGTKYVAGKQQEVIVSSPEGAKVEEVEEEVEEGQE